MSGLGRTTQCRGCGQEIAFIKTAKGKAMPVNPIALRFVPAGGPNTYVTEDGEVKRGREPEISDQGNTWIGYISHFATCPESDRFRKEAKR